MQEKTESMVLCASNGYEQKYYLNPDFENLPASVRDELKILCVLFTEEIGGIFLLEYDEDGNLNMKVMHDDFDASYDEIGCGLKIKQLQTEKRDLFESLEMFYKVFVLGEV